MKRWLMIAGGVLLLAIIVFASIKGSKPKGKEVYLESVKPRHIESVVAAPGQVDPKVKVNISAHVIGKIDRLYFREGDSVKRGQKLVDLEKVAYVAQRDRLSAELQNQRIEVRRARLSLANAEVQYRRAERLRSQGIEAEEPFERARLAFETARENLASAEEGVRQAEAGLAQAADDLTRTTIVAPMDGKVVQLSAHEGEVVITGTMNNPGSVIAVLADLSEILVEAEVTETEVVRIKPRQEARIEIDAVQDHEYHGTVAEIGSSATTRSGGTGVRYFTVKIALRDADDRLRPGMTAQVDIVTESKKNARSVPVQSVVSRDPKSLDKKKKPAQEASSEPGEMRKYVLVEREGKASMVEVKTGISDAMFVEITSGLKGDEKVVTGPFRVLKNLKNGDAIQQAKEETEKESKQDEAKDQEES